MAFIQGTDGATYAPGWFLGHEECERKTKQIAQEGATTATDGSKYVKMGTIYPSNDSNAIGFVYEDVDVSKGDMPGSVVTKGTVIIDRLPEEPAEGVLEALEAKGFTFIETTPEVTRPY